MAGKTKNPCVSRFLFSGLTGTALATALFLSSCAGPAPEGRILKQPLRQSPPSAPDEDGFVWKTEQFADLKLIRYQIPGWEQLSAKQQALVYCLNMAGLSGRDIMYDQNNRYNLRIRRLLEDIYVNYEGDRNTVGWQEFEVYLKRIWFSNGIHHHYANTKHQPGFSEAYMDHLLAETGNALDAELRASCLTLRWNPRRWNKTAPKALWKVLP